MKKKVERLKTWKFPQVVFAFFFLVIVFLYVVFAYLSLSPNILGINMDAFAKNRNTVKQTLYANRGTIYDKDGDALALNVSSYTVVAYLSESRSKNSKTPLHVTDPQMTAEKLSPVLNMSVEDLLKLLTKDSYQVELGPGGRGITELKKEEIEALNLPGIDFIEDQKRYYPNGNFASYVLGYAKENDQGEIEGELGIELKYNNLLKGKNGRLEYQRDRFGYKIPDTKEYRIDAEDGSDIYLTIDSNIQRFLESAVKEVEAEYQPEWMMIHVMDAKTGDILGTASTPSFDPNVRDITNYENPLVSYVYEPGSTMKTFTYMCAMEKGTYKGDDTYLSGNFKIGEDTVYDWNRTGWGTITYDKGYEYSSNVGIANLLDRYLSKKDLKDCLTKYGFGKTTGIELSREQDGDIKFNYPIEVATAGFGQGITTTAIQQLQALTMIANNGRMLKPHIIDRIVDPNSGEVTYKSKTEKSEQIVSTTTINKMKDLMYNVIHGTDPGSTGYMYKIDGFDIIGKTGTAQIYDTETGEWLSGKNDYIFSFTGLYPKDDPEIIIYAAMRKPTWGTSNGLAEASKEVMQSIAKYRNMFSEVISPTTINEYTMSNYINKTLNDAKAELDTMGVKQVIVGNGDKIIKQYPSKGDKVLSSDTVYLVTNDVNPTIPDMTGWSRNDAVRMIEFLGLSYEEEGYGYVTSQSIPGGTAKGGNTAIKITLSEKYGLAETQEPATASP